MFLVDKDQGASPDALQAAFDALPQVWSGKVSSRTRQMSFTKYAVDYHATGLNDTARNSCCCPPSGGKTFGT